MMVLYHQIRFSLDIINNKVWLYGRLKKVKPMKKSNTSLAVMLLVPLFIITNMGNVFAADKHSFEPLFNGSDLSGWDTWVGPEKIPTMPSRLWTDMPPAMGLNIDPKKVYSVVTVDDAPAIRISGETWGALVSQQEYSNYHLRLEFKWGTAKHGVSKDKPRNSGLLYHSVGEIGGFWNCWMSSAEFEIMRGNTGDFLSLDGVTGNIPTTWEFSSSFPWHQYTPGEELTHASGMAFWVGASHDPERAIGEWNQVELYVFEDKAIQIVNGVEVLRVIDLNYEKDDKTVSLREGKLQLQSEGSEVFYRNIEVRPITALPAKK